MCVPTHADYVAISTQRSIHATNLSTSIRASGEPKSVRLSLALLRCAGHVLTEGNSVLNDDKLTMLVILRMNRKFMEFMRKHYNHLTTNYFGKTIIGAGGDSEEPDAN